MKWEFEQEFRLDHPETVGETDHDFDLDNYKDWLELQLSEARKKVSELEQSASNCNKHIVNTRFSEDEEDEENFEEEEPDFKICMCCGSVQQSGMSCKKCAGPLRDGFL